MRIYAAIYRYDGKSLRRISTMGSGDFKLNDGWTITGFVKVVNTKRIRDGDKLYLGYHRFATRPPFQTVPIIMTSGDAGGDINLHCRFELEPRL